MAPTSTALINQEALSPNGTPMLIGACARNAFSREPYRQWFEATYQSFQPDTSVLRPVGGLDPSVRLTLFLGTWCGDSRREVPRLLKILDYLKAKPDQVQLILLDNRTGRYKQSPTHEQRGLGIFRQPTFVVRRNGQEVGRIIQNPVESLEKDLVRILTGKPYIPAFGVAWKLGERFRAGIPAMDDRAIAEFASEHRAALQNIYALDGYGYVLAAEGQFEEALIILKINALCFPQEAISFNSLGEVYRQMGKKQLAIRHFQKALTLNPSIENSRNWLQQWRVNVPDQPANQVRARVPIGQVGKHERF